jgi:hypothetical protein
MGDCAPVCHEGGGVMVAGFDWRRWHRFHRAASLRFDRHRLAGIPVKERWARYDRAMDFAAMFLKGIA